MGSRESIVIDMHVFDLIWENAMESEDPICLTAVSVAICDDRRDCHCRNGEPGYEVIPAPLRRFGASPIFCQRSAREDCIYLLPMTTVGIASCQAESKVECIFFFLAVGISTVRAHTHTHTHSTLSIPVQHLSDCMGSRHMKNTLHPRQPPSPTMQPRRNPLNKLNPRPIPRDQHALRLQPHLPTRPLRRRKHQLRISLLPPRELRCKPPQTRLEPGLNSLQIPRHGREQPPLPTRPRNLQSGRIEHQRRRRARSPPVRMRDPRIIPIRRIVQRPIRTIPLDERRLGHPRIVQHEPPLPAHQIQSALRLARKEVGLQLEAGGEGGDGGSCLWGGGAVGPPAGREGGGDGGGLGCGQGEVGFEGPGVAVLWVEGGGFVVAVEADGWVPESGVGGGFEGACDAGPGRGGGGVVEGCCQEEGFPEDEVEDGVCFDVLLCV